MTEETSDETTVVQSVQPMAYSSELHLAKNLGQMSEPAMDDLTDYQLALKMDSPKAPY